MPTWATGKKLENAHTDSIWAADWCNGSVVTGSLDGTVKLWNIDGDNIISTQLGSKRRVGVTSITTTRDGNRAVVCYEDSHIQIFDLENKSELSSLQPGLFEAWHVCLSPGDDVIASGNNRGQINIWSTQEGHERVATLETNNKFILTTVFSTDGKLASAGVNGVVSLFDMATQSIFHRVEAHALPIRSIAFSPSGDLIYSASEDRHVSVCDIRSGHIINSFSHAGITLSVDASPDQRHFAVGSANHCVTLWDLGMQRCVERFETQHSDRVSCVTFDESDGTGRKFVSVGDDATIQLFNV